MAFWHISENWKRRVAEQLNEHHERLRKLEFDGEELLERMKRLNWRIAKRDDHEPVEKLLTTSDERAARAKLTPKQLSADDAVRIRRFNNVPKLPTDG